MESFICRKSRNNCKVYKRNNKSLRKFLRDINFRNKESIRRSFRYKNRSSFLLPYIRGNSRDINDYET